MFAGTMEEFQGDGIMMSGSWLSNSISVKLLLPKMISSISSTSL